MEIKLEGKKLIITAELDKGTPSKTGKTMILASTHGFVNVPGSDIKVSLNVCK